MGEGPVFLIPDSSTDKVPPSLRVDRNGRTAMLPDETLLGIRKPDLRALKPLKVRLPLEHVLQLHRMRIVGEQTVSEIVADAIEEYLTGLSPRRRDEAQEQIDS